VEAAGDQLEATARSLVTVPPKLDDVLDRVKRDDLTVQVQLDDEHDVLDRLAKRIAYSILAAVGVLSTAILYSFNQTPEAAIVAGVITIPVGALLYRSLRRKRGVTARPQFTRQEMRRRRDE